MEVAQDKRITGRVALADFDDAQRAAIRGAGRALRELRAQNVLSLEGLVSALEASNLPPEFRQRMLRVLEQVGLRIPPETPLVDVVASLRAEGEAFGDDPEPDPDAVASALRVDLMTLYASKGLTADYVAVVDTFREVIPGHKPHDRERRLAYVAFSRARRDVVIIYPKYVPNGQRQRAGLGADLNSPARRPSPFIAEAGILADQARSS